MNLTFNLEVSPGEWIIQGPASGPRHLESPLTDGRFRELVANLREWASRPVPLDRPDPLATEAFILGLARHVSDRLTQSLLTEEDRCAVASALAQNVRTRLVIRVWPAAEGVELVADAVLALPWELLAPEEPGTWPVRDGRLAVIREAAREHSLDLSEPSGPLTLAVIIAAPEDWAGFPNEQESFRLRSALAPLGQRAVFADLGGLDDLVDLVADIPATAIHFRGYGLPGGLLFEDALGLGVEIPVAELWRRLTMVLLNPQRVGTFPGLFFLAAPFIAQATGDPLAAAAALHRSGFAQVIGFGPVSAELNARLEKHFYSELAAGKSALAAVEEARATLLEPVGEAGERVRYLFGWTQLAVYHRGPDLPLALPGQNEDRPLVPRRLVIAVSGLPVLEHGFIGRRDLQHEVRRKVYGGQRLVVIQGLPRIGKTALACRLMQTFAPEPADQLVLRCQELAGITTDTLLELRYQAEEHGRIYGFPFWDERVKDLRERIPDPAAGLIEVLRLVHRQRPGLAVHIDNAETLLTGPAADDPKAFGSWRPGLEAFWEEMEHFAYDSVCLVLITTRYAWEGLPARAYVGVSPMAPSDTIQLINSHELLSAIPRKLQETFAALSNGFPGNIEIIERTRRDFQLISPQIWTEAVAQNVHNFGWNRLERWNLGILLSPLPLRIELVDIPRILVPKLRLDLDILYQIGPDTFELLVMDLVHSMGYHIERPSKTFQRDGGIDFVFWRPTDPLSLPGAAQVKFHRSKSRSDGPKSIRELAGVLSRHFKQGLLVTNTTFTKSARWSAENSSAILRLRDIEDLKRWVQYDFKLEDPLRDFPGEIELAPNLWLRLK
jgi:Restriction endonuclease